MLVHERMSKNPYTITADTPVDEALRRMREAHVRRFPVLDKAGKLIGIVAEKDLLYASPSPATTLSIYEMHYLLSKLKVAEVMKRDIITVTEDTPVEDAARIMTDRKIGSLPVLRNGQLVGIITESDLFKLFQELLGARNKGVRLTMLIPEVKGTLAKITTAIAQKGGYIHALGTFLGEDPTNYLLTMKVADVPKDVLVETLKPLAVQMVDVRET
ncbi:MAG TPA: CBS domain-containing protein [Candidatus Methylomirabilis sp.]|nr:CBS domain-containing protein [Candidatus Methylomirabilis sp.]